MYKTVLLIIGEGEVVNNNSNNINGDFLERLCGKKKLWLY
jgi:hypothetical protein